MILIVNSARSFAPEGKYSLETNSRTLPYSAAVITSCLRDEGFNVKLIDLCNKVMPNPKYNLRNEDLNVWLNENHKTNKIDEYLSLSLKNITDLNYIKLIGFSIINRSALMYSLALAKEIKQNFKNIMICFGGSFITMKDVELSENIDFLVKGCGKNPIIHLANYVINNTKLDKTLPGLCFKDKLIYNRVNHEPAEDEKLPDFSDLNLKDYYNVNFDHYLPKSNKDILVVPYRTSLGCANSCSFCTVKLIDKLSFKSVDKVINELKALKSISNNVFIRFTDNSINSNPKIFEEILDRIINENLDINWLAMARVKTLNFDILKKMKIAGCKVLNLGVENFSEKMIKIYNKQFNPDDAINYIKYISGSGMRCQVNIILNGPQDSLNDYKINYEYIKNLLNDKNITVYLYPFKLATNSPIFKNPKKYGIELVSSMNQKKQIYKKQKLSKSEWKDIGIDITEFIKRKKIYVKRIQKLRKLLNLNSKLLPLKIHMPIFMLEIISNIYHINYWFRILKRILKR